MWRRAIFVGVAVGWAVLATRSLLFFSVTGRLWPLRVVEELDSPVAVTAWGKEGLYLRDGRLVRLPGIAKLPETSEALSRATGRGVQVTPEGRVLGQVRVCHTCGNDPVREHWARVDLAHVLMYLHEGRYESLPDHLSRLGRSFDGVRFLDSGWNDRDFRYFRLWSKRLQEMGR